MLKSINRSGGQNGLHFGDCLWMEYITDITGDLGFGTPEIDSRYSQHFHEHQLAMSKGKDDLQPEKDL